MTKIFDSQKHALMGMLFALVLLPNQVVASDALQRLPENTLGFAVVRNLIEANNKFEKLIEPLDVTFPSPLTFAKIITGLDAGLDTSGNLVIAILPGGDPQKDFEPLVFLPVTSYAVFANSIKADSSGAICRVTLLGEDILVAQDGAYAMLMNVEHRQTMEELLELAAEPVPALAPFAGWLTKQDGALVLMPQGIEVLSHWKVPLARRHFMIEDIEMIGELTPFSQFLSLFSSPMIRNWLHANVDLAAVGVRVDDQSNVRVGQQLVLKENSPVARLAPKALLRPAAKLGLTNKPLVFTAGGPVAPGWGKQLAAFLRQSEQFQAAETGLENLSSAQWKQEEKAFQLLLADARSCSVVMLPGEKGEPLMGNFFGVATVVDVPKYMKSLPQVIETWNELTQLSTNDIKPEFELRPLTIAGKAGHEITEDIATTARDANTPEFNWMLESALGPTGKLHIQLIPFDQTTFVFGMATREQLTQLLATLGDSDLTQPPGRQATLQLLQPAAPWKMLIQPQDCLRWASRFTHEFINPLSDQETVPLEMPASPPVGITLQWIDRHWECEVVCPAETWKALGKYLEGVSNH